MNQIENSNDYCQFDLKLPAKCSQFIFSIMMWAILTLSFAPMYFWTWVILFEILQSNAYCLDPIFVKSMNLPSNF